MVTRRPSPSSGFTLIELLIVVALIGIITSIAVGQYRQSIVKAKEAVLRENLFTMRTQINNFFADKGRYPSSLQELVEASYLREMPVDPITRSASTWQEKQAEMIDTDIATEPGIEDVHSGAQGNGLDGTPYGEW
jgi:general secretion pathway protein G